MKRDVIIIGGGIIGLTCAYFLKNSGREVTVIDEGDITDCTSFGNAGLLSAFDKTPLSYPGVVAETLKLMLKGESPAKIHPTMDLKLYKWLLKFVKSANDERLKRTLMLFERFGQISLDYYHDMQENVGLDLDFNHDGMLSVFTEQKSFDKKIAKYSEADDSRFELIDKTKIKEYIPIIKDDVKGAILFKKNARFDPKRVMNELKRHLESIGVEFILNEKIVDMKLGNKKIKEISSKTNSYEAETFIMSTGYQTLLAKKRGKELMMTPAKGYSITFDMPNELRPKVSTMFADLFIVMTPRRDNVRITSKLELGSTDTNVVKAQIESIKNNLRKYTIPFEMKNEKEWCGFRPLTPNDMPLIGRDEEYSNLIYAMGLGWLGMTFAPAIGEIIRDMVVNEEDNKDSAGVMMFSGFYQY